MKLVIPVGTDDVSTKEFVRTHGSERQSNVDTTTNSQCASLLQGRIVAEKEFVLLKLYLLCILSFFMLVCHYPFH